MAQQSNEHGNFYWNELMSRDVARDKRFYTEALGWNFEGMPMPDGTYWVAKMNGKPAGGLFDISGPQFGSVPEGWMSYIAVDDVDARTTKAQGLGARLMKPIFDVPGGGRIAILTEPGGAGIGWITPVPRQGEQACNTRSFRRTNGSPRARRCWPRRRNSPARATRLPPSGARCLG